MSEYAIFDKETGKPADDVRFDSEKEAEQHFESEGGDYDHFNILPIKE